MTEIPLETLIKNRYPGLIVEIENPSTKREHASLKLICKRYGSENAICPSGDNVSIIIEGISVNPILVSHITGLKNKSCESCPGCQVERK